MPYPYGRDAFPDVCHLSGRDERAGGSRSLAWCVERTRAEGMDAISEGKRRYEVGGDVLGAGTMSTSAAFSSSTSPSSRRRGLSRDRTRRRDGRWGDGTQRWRGRVAGERHQHRQLTREGDALLAEGSRRGRGRVRDSGTREMLAGRGSCLQMEGTRCVSPLFSTLVAVCRGKLWPNFS
ncbi:hypothetical protein SCHPADRAFT_754872 [Schizopora paradoxa]|uniref:Uncharacterized protein n=1 Tax=Schizopora paradoxa TaxID=27342 RepID=A0A0H2RHY5_9AGAM|nr:hypothetical protein SCHPADRAFT_754872 [Schizopora paradoxa]